jgi:predicted ester cyclase
MPAEENKALVRRLFDEGVNHRNPDVLKELISPAMIVDPDLPRGPEGMRALVTWLHGVFDGLHYTVEDLLAEGDTVAVRLRAWGIQVGEYNGIPGTGKPVTFAEMVFFRIVNHTIEEWWVVADRLDILHQTGALPAGG